MSVRWLRPDDLDAAVLRLAYTVGGRYALVVLAAAADVHGLARDAEPAQRVGDVVSAPLGEPLVVAGGARGVGVAGHVDRDHASGAPRIGGLVDDAHADRRDCALAPIEGDREPLTPRR